MALNTLRCLQRKTYCYVLLKGQVTTSHPQTQLSPTAQGTRLGKD